MPRWRSVGEASARSGFARCGFPVRLVADTGVRRPLVKRSAGGSGRRPMVAIVGPTAAGKSALALDLALECGAEVISVDSRQVFRHLDIGTAKATPEMCAAVPHHLIDIVEPDELYDAGQFARDATLAIREIRSRGRTPILCGGSGLYLRALVEGMADLPESDPVLRVELHAEAEGRGDAEMHDELSSLDAPMAARLAVADRRRVLRALEVFRQTGRRLSDWQAEHARRPRPFDLLPVVLSPSPDILESRIRARTEEMWVQGLVEETRAALGKGFSGDLASLQSIGYREAQAFLAGDLSAEAAVDAIVLASRQYAKRQRTWFRSLREAHWLEEPRWPVALRQEVLDCLE